MTGEPGGKGDSPRQGADNEAYAENHERIFGKRCIRHPSINLDQVGVCPRCLDLWEQFNDKTGEWEPKEWKK